MRCGDGDGKAAVAWWWNCQVGGRCGGGDSGVVSGAGSRLLWVGRGGECSECDGRTV